MAYLDADHFRHAALAMNQRGIEMTPGEVEKTVRDAIADIRERSRRIGVEIADDETAFQLLTLKREGDDE
jgi:hypothetical protein